MVIAFSGGKDSTVVLQLVYEMLCNLPKDKQRKTYAIASNTLVEAPQIQTFLKRVITSINQHAKSNDIPFEVLEVTPQPKDQFWFNLIGKGYPSPTRTFRWCTDRLKITPTKQIIEKITKQHGSVLLCLGVRSSESSARKQSIQKRTRNEDGFSQHDDFPNTLIYSPIVNWTTDDVWAFLTSAKPRWDKNHDELFELYAKASGEECQFITDLRQNSCGGSRFGCWICTVVNEDKSMQGFIANGETALQPLNDFRNYIKALREDPNSRSDYKRDGRAIYKNGGFGPFLSSFRIQILRRLLDAEKQFKENGGCELISDSQIQEIQKQWTLDFDLHNSAIKIAKEFNRMNHQKLDQHHSILHSEILKEIANSEQNQRLNLKEEDLNGLIASTIEAINYLGRNKANAHIKEKIKNLIEDKTAKESKEA